MTPTLNELTTAAIELAGGNETSFGARLWQMVGGRTCPLDWGDCSQAVYVDLKTGDHDYGDQGGPGHADCVRYCKHGMQPRPADDDEDELLDDDFQPAKGKEC